ncbi:MAG: disulfide bond formation protein B [Halobacteriovoraceae bacterium]|nr:disulfide bond formation protein B [Halobacteriovoraceae bacterium]
MGEGLVEHAVRVKLNRLFVMVMIGAAAVLAISYGAELTRVKPCTLCKLQRIPYVLLAVNGFLGLMMPIKRGIMRVLQVCMVGGILLGSIHLGVIVGMIKLPCSREKIRSTEEFRKGLEGGSYREVWKALGIPGAFWNVGICFGGLVLTKKHGPRRIQEKKT